MCSSSFFKSSKAWIGEAIQFVTVLARCGSPATSCLIGQSGTTAQQPAADEDLAFSRKSKVPSLTAQTPPKRHSPN